jgi:hypothetical protein
VDGRVTGLSVTRRGTQLTHLFFVDGNLLFYKTNLFEWSNIQAILKVYERLSGHKVNRNKASIFFNHNTHPGTKTYISSVIGIDPTQQYEQYLCLLAIIGHSKMNARNESLEPLTAFCNCYNPLNTLTANRF